MEPVADLDGLVQPIKRLQKNHKNHGAIILYCGQPSNGNMIMCEHKDCTIVSEFAALPR